MSSNIPDSQLGSSIEILDSESDGQPSDISATSEVVDDGHLQIDGNANQNNTTVNVENDAEEEDAPDGFGSFFDSFNSDEVDDEEDPPADSDMCTQGIAQNIGGTNGQFDSSDGERDRFTLAEENSTTQAGDTVSL